MKNSLHWLIAVITMRPVFCESGN